MEEIASFVGLDVHKETISVAVAEGGRGGGVRFIGEIPNTPAALDRLAAKLAKDGGNPRFCYG